MADDKGRWEQFNIIIDMLDLDIKEKGLLLIIFRYVNYKKGYADPSRALIKKLTGISDNRTLDKIFDSLIEKGVLSRSSGKGTRSRYFIKVGGEITLSVKNAPSGEITPLVGGEITPQKEKKRKLKENNIYSHIFDFWNSKKIIIHKSLNDDIEKSIKKALKIYCEDEIIKAIDIYGDILTSDFYFNYKWSLKDFLNRKNGISTFMEDGSNKVNYEKWKENNRDEVKNSRRYSKGNNRRFTEGTEEINYRPSINTREYTDEEREAAGLI